jgi:uncharacterized protein (TIGR02646 family)
MTSEWIWQIRVYKGFSLSASEHAYIKEVIKQPGYTHKSWDSIQTNAMKRIKRKIYRQLKHEQKGRCTYCGAPFIGAPADREHILPKEKYLKLMFNSYNIVLCCINCNRYLKGTYDPLRLNANHKRMATSGCMSGAYSYESWHPFFHAPEAHFKYHGKVNHIIKGITPQGLKHISLFKLDKMKSIEERLAFATMMEKRRGIRPKRLIRAVDAVLEYRSNLGT